MADASPSGPDTAAREALYQELILTHYRRPHGKGRLPHPDGEATARNPLCGEDVTVSVTLDRGAGDNVQLSEIRFTGQGCAISQASASMMTDLAVGRSPGQLSALEGRLRALLHGDPAAATDETLGPLRALSGIARVPARLPCALLPWEALRLAVQQATSSGHSPER